MNTLLITGTGSGVGKTVVLSALAAYWQTYYASHGLGVMQPIALSDRDRTLYTRLFSLAQTADEITPEYLKTSLPLPVALEKEGRTLALDRIWNTLQALTTRNAWVLLEGLDSLGTPLTADTVVADLAWDWRLPTLLVVPVQPGAIPQAVAQVALARQRRVHLKGIVLNCTRPCSPEEIEQVLPATLLRSLTHVPILGCIPYLDDLTNLAALTQAASGLTLEQLLPASMPSTALMYSNREVS